MGGFVTFLHVHILRLGADICKGLISTLEGRGFERFILLLLKKKEKVILNAGVLEVSATSSSLDPLMSDTQLSANE